MKDPSASSIAWSAGRWTHEPVESCAEGDDLVATAVAGSDAWRHTSYGFVHDSEHALVAPLRGDSAMEVSFTATLEGQFDQAGIFLRASRTVWVKAGVELVDGQLCVGAVVTRGTSDWSAAERPEWNGRRLTIRASRSPDSVTIRARADDSDFQMVRLAPFPMDAVVEAGPYFCAPTRAGFSTRFHSWHVGAADRSLHA